MDNKLSTILKRLQGHLKLSSQEKSSMRAQILERIQVVVPDITSPYIKQFSPVQMFATRAAVVTLSVFMSGGIAAVGFAARAEVALPGDNLYNVKVHINEEIKASLISSPEAEIAFEGERISRRIDEAKELAREGNFDEAAKDLVIENIEKHTEAATKDISAFAFANETETLTEVTDSIKEVLTEKQVSLEAFRVSEGLNGEISDVIEEVQESVSDIERLEEIVDEVRRDIANDEKAAQDVSFSNDPSNEPGKQVSETAPTLDLEAGLSEAQEAIKQIKQYQDENPIIETIVIEQVIEEQVPVISKKIVPETPLEEPALSTDPLTEEVSGRSEESAANDATGDTSFELDQSDIDSTSVAGTLSSEEAAQEEVSTITEEVNVAPAGEIEVGAMITEETPLPEYTTVTRTETQTVEVQLEDEVLTKLITELTVSYDLAQSAYEAGEHATTSKLLEKLETLLQQVSDHLGGAITFKMLLISEQVATPQEAVEELPTLTDEAIPASPSEAPEAVLSEEATSTPRRTRGSMPQQRA